MSSTPLSRLDVVKRAGPLIFANATVPLAGIIDTFVLSYAGDKTDLGGVALAVYAAVADLSPRKAPVEVVAPDPTGD